MENAAATRHTHRALTVLAVGLAGLLCWVAALVGWVSWQKVAAWLADRAGWIASLLVVLGVIGAGGWSLLRRNRSRRRDLSRSPLSWWVIVAALFVVALVAWGTTSWLLGEANHAKDVTATRVEAIKTGLGIAAGTGGVFALLLAVRRQWHQERTAQDTVLHQERMALHQERMAQDTVLDATERRVTELYTKAADQLGSDKAPVRLAGLYALERLAQANPSQRQTVVNVLCAYLRMPYQPPTQAPRDGADEDGPTREKEKSAPREATPRDDPAAQAAAERECIQEREVRLTAQRILTRHLRHGSDPREPPVTFWENSDLDLTGALLIDFALSGCQARTARFDGATFPGGAWFGGATFTEGARFDGATFTGDAKFNGATFTGDASFDRATFTGNASFEKTTFTGNAWFDGATFTGDDAWFNGATFTGNARFNGATFTWDARFDGATFTGDARFNRATFTRNARFDRATFTGNDLASARFATRPGLTHVLPPGWRLVPSADSEWSVAVRVDGDHDANI